MRLQQKSQSILEFVVILTAIVAAMVFVGFKILKPKLELGMDGLTGQMLRQIQRAGNVTSGGGSWTDAPPPLTL